jgi:hypothetical protein
VLEKDLV